MVVNQSLARRFWGDRNPIGQRISLDGGRNWRAVVGIVGDVKQYALDQEAADEIYRPFSQFPSPAARVLVRSDLPAATVEKLVRDSLRAIDPRQPVFEVRTLCSPENVVRPDTDAMSALSAMRRTGVSRLMVAEGDQFLGILTLKDLLRFFSLKMELEQTP